MSTAKNIIVFINEGSRAFSFINIIDTTISCESHAQWNTATALNTEVSLKKMQNARFNW